MANETIATFDPFNDPIISEHDGIVRYEDIIPGSTLNEEINAETGNIEKLSPMSATNGIPRSRELSLPMRQGTISKLITCLKVHISALKTARR